MRKLKENIENRIKSLLLKGEEEDREVYFSYSDYDIEITYIFNQKLDCEHTNKQVFLSLTFNTYSRAKSLLNVTNVCYKHKELMENINTIHNNLCNEENWEEII